MTIKINYNDKNYQDTMKDRLNELYEVYHLLKNITTDKMSNLIDQDSDCYSSFDKYLALNTYYSSIINSIDVHCSSGEEYYGMTDDLRTGLRWRDKDTIKAFCTRVAELMIYRSIPISSIPDIDLGEFHNEVLSIITKESTLNKGGTSINGSY